MKEEEEEMRKAKKRTRTDGRGVNKEPADEVPGVEAELPAGGQALHIPYLPVKSRSVQVIYVVGLQVV